MRKMIAIYGLAVMLVGCALPDVGVGQIPTSPAAVADKTTLDEKAGLGVEGLYQAANAVGRVAMRLGASKAAVAALDNKAYAAVKRARSAYDAGNAASYAEAVAAAKSTIGELLALVPAKSKGSP